MTKVVSFICKNKQFTLFSLLAAGVIAVALLAPYLPIQNPYAAVMQAPLQAPSAEHWFGTDKLGRDVFARVIYGARYSLTSTFALVLSIFMLGSVLGVVAGYFGKLVDAVIMRIADMLISFPGMLLAIAIAGIMGASITNAVIAITLVSWTKYARLARSLVLKIRHADYVAAAEVTGSRTFYILWRYMLPNALPTLIITAATDIGSMLLELAGLSFLGFGALPPTPEWGYMLNEGRTCLENAPWVMIFPGLAIFIVVVIFNLLGDSLRDVLDPKSE